MRLFRNKSRSRVDPIIVDYTLRVQKSGLFDAEWYLATYPELAGFMPGPLAHFCEYGMREHRDPGPNFDTRRYLDAIPEAGNGPLPPLLHALETGEPEHGCPIWLRDDDASLVYLIRTSGLFDEAWYLDTYPDVARSGWDALAHFLEYGALELRDPSPAFDAEHYAITYPHFRETFATPIAHYLRLGLRRGYRPIGLSPYTRWLAKYDELNADDIERIAAEPVPSPIHVIVVVDQVGVGEISTFLEGLANQTVVSWRAKLLRGQDIDLTSWKTVVAQVANEPRIACIEASKDAFNEFVDGEIVVLATGASQLRPHALYAFIAALNHSASLGAYSDHDRIDRAGTRHAPVFKPAMSAVLMRQVPYAGSVIALVVTPHIRKALALALGRLEEPTRFWADLLLELDCARVIRIPLILYHVAVDNAVPPSRTNQPVPDPSRTMARPPNWPPKPLPTVQIVIPTRDRSTLLRACIDSILELTDYPSRLYRVVIVDNESSEDETAQYFAEVAANPQVRVIVFPEIFNFSKICNAGAKDAEADILIFLNNDTTVRQADWLRILVSYASQPTIGIVGVQLIYPDETVQHGGVILGVESVGAHALVDLPVSTAQAIDATRELSAVTGACLTIRRSLFEELGGFDPLLRVDFNDVALCCKALEAGYRNLYVAEPLLYHHESVSRGRSQSRSMRGRSIREAIRVRQRYAAVIRDDPGYNPNLSLMKIGTLAVPPRVIPPWRRPLRGVRKVLLLRNITDAGSEISRMVRRHAAFLTEQGFEIVVGGSDREPRSDVSGYRNVTLEDAAHAAIYAIRDGVDAIVAYTAPFFAVTSHLGRRPLVYIVDHGALQPDSSADRDAWEDATLEKRLCASLARGVFSTSAATRDALFGQEAILLGHYHASDAVWSESWAERRAALREAFGFTGRFVVLNFCHMGVAGDLYDGLDDYVALSAEYSFTDPTLEGRVLFVAADRDTLEYPLDRTPLDLTMRNGVSAIERVELLAASDLFLTTQRRQGVDCGITQALAMGLPVVVSDLALQRAYPVEVASDVPELCKLVALHALRWRTGSACRKAVIVPGEDPLEVLAGTITRDLDQDSAEHWI